MPQSYAETSKTIEIGQVACQTMPRVAQSIKVNGKSYPCEHFLCTLWNVLNSSSVYYQGKLYYLSVTDN